MKHPCDILGDTKSGLWRHTLFQQGFESLPSSPVSLWMGMHGICPCQAHIKSTYLADTLWWLSTTTASNTAPIIHPNPQSSRCGSLMSWTSLWKGKKTWISSSQAGNQLDGTLCGISQMQINIWAHIKSLHHHNLEARRVKEHLSKTQSNYIAYGYSWRDPNLY